MLQDFPVYRLRHVTAQPANQRLPTRWEIIAIPWWWTTTRMFPGKRPPPITIRSLISPRPRLAPTHLSEESRRRCNDRAALLPRRLSTLAIAQIGRASCRER